MAHVTHVPIGDTRGLWVTWDDMDTGAYWDELIIKSDEGKGNEAI